MRSFFTRFDQARAHASGARPLREPKGTHDVQQPSLRELLMDPIKWTSQEQWFIDKCVVPKHTQKVIVSNFRGCGKTTTLARVRARWFLHWRFFLTRRLEFYNSETVHQAFTKTTTTSFVEYLLQLAGTCVLAALVLLWRGLDDGNNNTTTLHHNNNATTKTDSQTNSISKSQELQTATASARRENADQVTACPEKDSVAIDPSPNGPHAESTPNDREDGNISKLLATGVAVMVIMGQQLPTPEGIVVTVIAFAAPLLFRCRRRVLILDDVTQASKHVQRRELPDLQALLARLSSFETQANVIFVSSHEGMQIKFVDKSDNVFTLRRMPPLQIPEMEARLKRMGITLPDSTSLEDVKAKWGEQLALSARFNWIVADNKISLTSPTRSELWLICKMLVLQATDFTAIACSQLVDISDYAAFPLEGCITEEAFESGKSAVEYVAEAFPGIKKVPHRLVIPMILAATTHVANRDRGNESSMLSSFLPCLGIENVVELGPDVFVAVSSLRDFIVEVRQLEYFRSLLREEDRHFLDEVLEKLDPFNPPSPGRVFRCSRGKVLAELGLLLEQAAPNKTESRERLQIIADHFECWIR